MDQMRNPRVESVYYLVYKEFLPLHLSLEWYEHHHTDIEAVEKLPSRVYLWQAQARLMDNTDTRTVVHTLQNSRLSSPRPRRLLLAVPDLLLPYSNIDRELEH